MDRSKKVRLKSDGKVSNTVVNLVLNNYVLVEKVIT